MLRAQAKAAVADFNHDMKAGGMAHVRDRKDACWAELSRMPLDPVDPAEAKAAYCAAYVYVAHFVDGAVAKQLQRPPSPSFERDAVITEIRDGLMAAQCPPESVNNLAGLIVSRALEELDCSARR